MARRQLRTLDDYARAIRNGYGIGTGSKYKPWIGVKDVPSDGESSIIQGITVDRLHELLSQLESRTLPGIEFKSNVIDIREQFPLLPLDVVMGLAERYGIQYPNVPGTKTPAVLSTDFLVTCQDNRGKTYVPITCKYECDLLDRYELEKLEIQRLFWASLGCTQLILTERNVDITIAENLTFISSFFRGEDRELPFIEKSLLLPNRIPPRTYTIQALIDELGDVGASNEEQARRYLFGAIWNRQLVIDLSLDFQETGYIDVLGWNTELITESSGDTHANLA